MKEQEAILRLKDHFRIHNDGRPTPYLDEAVNMAISALEKQIAKKPILYSKKKSEIKEGDFVYVKCPSCGEYILSCFHYPPWNKIQKSHKYCENCGQKLDWD